MSINYSVKYVGGHSACREEAKGTLFIFGNPQNRLLFESSKLRLEIAADKLRDARLTSTKYVDPGLAFMVGAAALFVKAEQKALLIQYEDNSGMQQTPIFHFLVNTKRELETYPDQACANITNLIANTRKAQNKVETPKPIENTPPQATNGFFCKYCGRKNDEDAVWCQSCGKKLKTDAENDASVLTTICKTCGAENKPQAVFCKKCGYPMQR